MPELYPFLFLLMIYGFIASTVRAIRKNNGAGNTRKAPGKPAAVKAPPAADAASSPENRPVRPETFSGSLSGGTREGEDPCHDDPRRMPFGSLQISRPEGTDPCHDDPAAMPYGSLQADQTEGTDPCHDGWNPAGFSADSQEKEASPAAGLTLGWTGNEIVRGFVYGEILKRKTGA